MQTHLQLCAFQGYPCSGLIWFQMEGCLKMCKVSKTRQDSQPWWVRLRGGERKSFYEKTVRAQHFSVKHSIPHQHVSLNISLPFQAGFTFITHFDHIFARKEIRKIITVLCVIMSLI